METYYNQKIQKQRTQINDQLRLNVRRFQANSQKFSKSNYESDEVIQSMKDYAQNLQRLLQVNKRDIKQSEILYEKIKLQRMPKMDGLRQQLNFDESFLQEYEKLKKLKGSNQQRVAFYIWIHPLGYQLLSLDLWSYRIISISQQNNSIINLIRRFFKKKSQQMYLIGAALSIGLILVASSIRENTISIDISTPNINIPVPKPIQIFQKVQKIKNVPKTPSIKDFFWSS